MADDPGSRAAGILLSLLEGVAELRTGRILVVARAEGLRLTLSELLESEEYEVASAATGADALALMQEAEFDLLLTDTRLDDIDTRSILAEARRRWPHYASLILVDDRALERVTAVLADYAAYDYLLKPCVPTEVLAKVTRALEHNRLTREVDFYSRQLQASIDTARELYSTLDARLLEAMAALDDRDRRMIRFCEDLGAPLAAIGNLAEQLTGLLEGRAGGAARANGADVLTWSKQIQSHAAQLSQLVAATLDRARRDLPQAERMGLNPGELQASDQEQVWHTPPH